jgi:hypothetical protein
MTEGQSRRPNSLPYGKEAVCNGWKADDGVAKICDMPFWVKRILLKSGELLTERELSPDENRFEGPAPVVGDVLTVTANGRRFDAKVIWGNWPGREHGDVEVPIRVEEL